MRTLGTLNWPVAILASSLLIACGGGATEEAAESAGATEAAAPQGGQSTVQDDESQKNVVGIAVGSKDHTTLVAAVQAAELVDVLSNAGPFTVYAPVNAAFDALPAGTVEGLLKPEKKGDLQDILQYHVFVGVLKPEMVRDGQSLNMVNGSNVKFTVKDGKVMINDASILAAVPASNGLVCVIDKVLLPPPAK
ncbi:MAG: fasciclin domain-containing protein [Flavobacteriales bacterium]|nr:fasciclin domain-containing protein [Flavobacteriales bacterium]MBK9287060.1 fasciclin domain-containing protein [Flavobacteriales bacterium]